MDAQQALADLTEISSQIQAAVVFDEGGRVAGSTLDDPAGAELARAAGDLFAQAGEIKTGEGSLNQLEAATHEGSVFVVRDGNVRIAATTGPEPTVGLVFYDLKSALRQVTAKPERKKAAPRKTTPRKTTARKTTTAKKSATRKKKSDAS